MGTCTYDALFEICRPVVKNLSECKNLVMAHLKNLLFKDESIGVYEEKYEMKTYMDNLTIRVSTFCGNLRARWRGSGRSLKIFRRQNSDWLEKQFNLENLPDLLTTSSVLTNKRDRP